MIAETCNKFDDKSKPHIMFSAHGVPKSYIEDGDIYQKETERTVEKIMEEMKKQGFENNHSLAY
jgi:ferrochelatase